MEKFVSIDKKSKKARKRFHALSRQTWGTVNPASRVEKSGKDYDRNREKRKAEKQIREADDRG